MSTESIYSPESPTLPEITKTIQATLRETYLRDEFPKVPWLADKWRVPTENYYIRLKLCEQECWRPGRDPTNVHVHEIFNAVDDIIRPRRIWIEGAAGYGKTSLVLRLARDWAKREKYIARKFDLVFAISMRWMRNRSLEDTIHELYNGSSDPFETVSAIDLAREKVLLIIDDYLDDDTYQNDDIVKLLNFQKYPQMTVIVTSRCGCSPDENVAFAFHNAIQKQIAIVGVTSTHLTSFLKVNAPDLPEVVAENIASQMTIFVKKGFSENVRNSPLISLLVAAASIEEEFSASETKTQVCADLLNFIIRRSTRASLEHSAKRPNFSVPFNGQNREENYVLFRLGELSVNALLKEHFQFDQNTIMNQYGKDVLQLGLFIKRCDLPGVDINCEEIYECVHSIFLEFMAAFYLCFLYINREMKKFRNLLKSLWFCCSSKSLIMPFVAGLLPDIAPELFIALTPLFRSQHGDLERITDILQECNLSKSLTDVVTPLLPETWVIDNSNFCRSSLHNALLDHGLISEKVKHVLWDVSSHIKLQLFSVIPKLDLCGPMSHLDPQCFTGIQCEELWYQLKYEDPTKKGPRNGWESIVSTTKHIQAQRVSFSIDDNVDTVLSLLCNQATSGQLQNINIHWINCRLVMNNHCMDSLTDLISKERICSLHLTLYNPTYFGTLRRFSASQLHLMKTSTKRDSYTKKEMHSLVKCAGKSFELQDLILIAEPSYMQYINMKLLCNKGKKSWRVLQLRIITDSDIKNIQTLSRKQSRL